jgi:beta-glucosidase
VQNKDYPHGWWLQRHRSKLSEIKAAKAPPQIVFIGDSITQGWEESGLTTWKKYFKSLNAINLGFNGDCTEHVLWRIEQGELDNMNPSIIIMMIGTNNAGHRKEDPQHTFLGIKAILSRIRQKQPNAQTVLLAIFPRGQFTNDPLRKMTSETNALIRQLADNKHIHYLDINEKFLTEDGELTKEVAEDFLHINAQQYDVWAKAMIKTISSLLL